MSNWTYINGLISVKPLGRTQPEKKYILDTILEHLPYVPGSEHGMETYTIQRKGNDSSSSDDEFHQCTTNAQDNYGDREGIDNKGWYRTQSTYFIIVDGSLRDTYFSETLKAFMNWFCRLAKRIEICDANISISGYDIDYNYKKLAITNENDIFSKLEEIPSWCNDTDGEMAWAEYLMWDKAENGTMPDKLQCKYDFNSKSKS